jgi:hypothetical protein
LVYWSFTALEIYSVAVYRNGSLSDRAHLASPDVPKALRVEVLHAEDLRRRIAIDWRSELVPAVDPGAAAHLRNAFAPLTQGGVVVVEYSPAKGTTVRVNRSIAVSGASHDLMLAFLDHWLGQRPVSEEIKRALTGGS